MKLKEMLSAIYFGIAFFVWLYNFIFVSYGTSAYEIGHDIGTAAFWPFHLLKAFF